MTDTEIFEGLKHGLEEAIEVAKGNKTAKITRVVLSDRDFDAMTDHEDDEPNQALIDLMKEVKPSR